MARAKLVPASGLAAAPSAGGVGWLMYFNGAGGAIHRGFR
jgi:hypothetical protein